MKRKPVIRFLSIAILIFLGCKKEKVADYRANYVGTYNLHYNRVKIIPVTPAVYDTIDFHYEGSISFKGTNSLQIDWYDGTTHDFIVSTNGTLSNCPDVSAGTISSSGIDIDYNQSDCPGTPNVLFFVKLSGSKQ